MNTALRTGSAATAMAALLSIASGAGAPPALAAGSDMLPASASAPDAIEAAQLTLINRHRRASGLRRLTVNSRLSRAASFMATDMAQGDYFSHTDSRGRSPFERIRLVGYPSDTWRGENIAAGNAEAGATFVQWRNSPGHEANMVGRHYRTIGIARVHSASSTYGWYWATEFGS